MKKRILFAAIITSVLFACTPEQPIKVPESSITKVVLPQPFHFHKALEVKPGLTFDVLSWGRGTPHGAHYMILRSDSTNMGYNTLSEEFEGQITDAWNMDLDSDGNPEIFIQCEGLDKESYLKLYVYEFARGGSAQELKFPELTAATKRKYRGMDSVYTKEGSLFREIPLYDEKDTAAVNVIEKKVLEYRLRGNRFDIHEIKEGAKED